MSDVTDFDNPPVVELVIGAQFSPLAKLTTGHLGWFWRQLGEEWIDPSDGPLLPDQFELFDRPWRGHPGGLELRLGLAPGPARFMIGHRDKDRLIQLQATQLHFNWRKQEGSYPRYQQIVAEFEDIFDRFKNFTRDAKLGEVLENQWELTYVDAFPQGEYWQDPVEWSECLPGLFGTLQAADGLKLEHRAAQWSYVIAPDRGRLHIVANPGRLANDARESLMVQMTARGPVGKGGSETLRAGLDLGHDVALKTFLRVTSDSSKERWKARS